MNRTCIVVADSRTARFYDVEESDAPRAKAKLIERAMLGNETDLRVLGESASGKARTETNSNRGAGPVHPVEAQRERHRVELDRRFGREIARQAGAIAAEWKQGTVILVAEPRLLGLLRETLRDALHRGVDLKELAKDYANLPVSELHEHLARGRLIPGQRGNGQ